MASNTELTDEMQNHSESKDPFDGYRKTCSRVFGRAEQSQLRYLQSFVELQQSMFVSCESVTANQISWLEALAKRPDGNIDAITNYSLAVLNSSVEGYLNVVSLLFESGIIRLDYYKKYFESLGNLLNQEKPLPKQ